MNEINSNRSNKLMRVLHYALLSFLFVMNICTDAMLGEGSFTGTGGYAIGGTPYEYFGMSYYYNPAMDYNWDGQQWIFETGAQWPPRCCKPNPCSSCGYRRASECSSPIEANGRTLKECWKVYKNHTNEG